jgi:hypothetical protein
MRYSRPKKSEQELAALPSLGTTEFEAHVRINGEEFTAETLVYLLRWAAAKQNTPLFDLCGRFLVGHPDDDGRWRGGHCEGIMVNLAKRFGFLSKPEQMLDFRGRCQSGLWKAIHGNGGFWECRFAMAFKLKCIESARSLSREENQNSEGREVDTDEIDIENVGDSEAVPIDEDVAARLSNPIHQAILLGEVRRLPKKQAHAFLLAHLEGRPIEGSGSNTVATLMNISPRMVYKHLAKGIAALKENAALRAIWFKE